MLQHGRIAGRWSLAGPRSDQLVDGAATVTVSRPGAAPQPLFLVKSASESIRLEADGAYANDNAIVIHADDTWQRTMARGSSRRPTGAPGRTGAIGTTHVSVGDLLSRTTDIAELHAAFAAEVLL